MPGVVVPCPSGGSRHLPPRCGPVPPQAARRRNSSAAASAASLPPPPGRRRGGEQVGRALRGGRRVAGLPAAPCPAAGARCTGGGMPVEPGAPVLHPQAAQTLYVLAPWGEGAGSSLTEPMQGIRAAILVMEATLLYFRERMCNKSSYEQRSFPTSH
ncbi:uncharacterized protein FN964_016272 isoform 2-T2 [Alca torda]